MDGELQTLDYQDPEVRQAPLEKSWLRSIDPEIPARLAAALILGDDIVVLSGPERWARARAETLAATAPLLRQAGFAVTAMTAPLSLSVLHDAISETLTDPANAMRPVIVMIEQAENLIGPTVQRLIALAALRRDGQPVLRFLIAGTPALWPAMQAAGLGAIGSDKARHVRLGVWHMVAKRPPETRLRTEPNPRLGGARACALPLGLAAAGVVCAGLVTLGHHVTTIRSQASSPAHSDARPGLPAIIPGHLPGHLPGHPAGSRRASAVSAAVASKAVAEPQPAPPRLSDITLHITIRYASGDANAARRAGAIASELRAQGMPADGPLASQQSGAGSSLSYGFDQDRTAAERLAQMVLPEAGKTEPRLQQSDAMRRPGEVSLFIGSNEKPGRSPPS